MPTKKDVIVFAEDDMSTTKVLLYLLTRDGYQVYPYSSGVGVAEGVREHRPDLIILDIMMPVKDGLTVLKEIRDEKENAEIPVVLLTATKDENSVNKSIEYGVADFIIKPFKLNELSIRIRKIIDSAQNKGKQVPVKPNNPDHFKAILDTVPVLICELGIDKQCAFLNKTWLDFTGRSVEQGLGSGWKDSIHKDDINRVLETHNSAFDSKKPFKIKYRLRHNSGDYKWILDNGTPQFSPEGVFQGYLVSCTDFSEQQKVQTELKKLSQAVMQSPVSIIITDYNGVIEFVNPFYTGLTGFALNESVGKVAGIFKRGEITEEESKQLWKTILAGTQWKGEVNSVKKNGDKFLESVTVSPIKNEDWKITNFVVIKENIHAKTQIINELTSSKDKAEELNRLNAEFLSSVSHEIKTALVGIVGFSDILKTELADSVYMPMINGILKSGNRLNETLDALSNPFNQ